MRKITAIAAQSLAAILFLILPAAAAPVGVPLLDVEIQSLTLGTSATAATDDMGYFSLPGLAADDYLLIISDPASDREYRQNFTVSPELPSALLHGRVTADDEVDVSFAVTASLYDEDGLPDNGTFAISLRFKWNGNSIRSHGKFWVFVGGRDVSAVENVILSSEHGSLETAAMKTNDEQTKLMAAFPKGEAYRALIPPDAVRGDRVDVTIAVVTPTGTQEEVVSIGIMGKK